MSNLPKPTLYASEIITKGGGIWMGCDDEDIVRRSHTPGETGTEVKAFYTEEQMLEYGSIRSVLPTFASTPNAVHVPGYGWVDVKAVRAIEYIYGIK